jgi:hypothetical protein
VIPDGTLSATAHPGPFQYPDSLAPIVRRPDGIYAEADPTDEEAGGAALNDPTYGLLTQRWTFAATGTEIWVRPSAGTAELLFDAASEHGPAGELTEVSGTFDSNMAWAVAYVYNGTAAFRWYDISQGQYTTTVLLGATSPRLTLDDKRPLHAAARDILLFYLREGALYYRLQRERYETEHWLMDVPEGIIGIGRAGMNEVWRVQVELLEEDDLWVGSGEVGASLAGLSRILEPIPWSLERLNRNVQTIASTLNALANAEWFTWAGDDVQPNWTPATEVTMSGGIAAPAIYVHDAEGRYQHVLLPWAAEASRPGLVMALPHIPHASWTDTSTGTLWDTLRTLQYWMRRQGWAVRTDVPILSGQLAGTLGDDTDALTGDPERLGGFAGALSDDAGLLAGTAA